MKVAVFGGGHWGKNLVRNFNELGALACVWDTDPERRQWIVEQFNVPVAQSPEQVFGDDAIGGVVIATPAPTHFELARAALEAGKHVMVEKPLCLDVFVF